MPPADGRGKHVESGGSEFRPTGRLRNDAEEKKNNAEKRDGERAVLFPDSHGLVRRRFGESLESRVTNFCNNILLRTRVRYGELLRDDVVGKIPDCIGGHK